MNALCRYLGRRKCAQSVSLQPPFLRPQLTEAQLAAKILDNGIQGDLHRVRGVAKVLVKLKCHKLLCWLLQPAGNKQVLCKGAVLLIQICT